MPAVRTLRVMADDVVEIHWTRIRQIPGVSPAEFEQESLIERYTAPPRSTWEARSVKLGEESRKEEP